MADLFVTQARTIIDCIDFSQPTTAFNRLERKIADALKRARADWQPRETAKDDGEPFLAIIDQGSFWSYDVVQVAWARPDGTMLFQPVGMPANVYDFWMPLPAPPARTRQP